MLHFHQHGEILASHNNSYNYEIWQCSKGIWHIRIRHDKRGFTLAEVCDSLQDAINAAQTHANIAPNPKLEHFCRICLQGIVE